MDGKPLSELRSSDFENAYFNEPREDIERDLIEWMQEGGPGSVHIFRGREVARQEPREQRVRAAWERRLVNLGLRAIGRAPKDERSSFRQPMDLDDGD